MKEETLKPLTDRIKQILGLNANDSFKIVQIDKTLRATEKPLSLGQFIHCNGDGKPLEKPEYFEKYILSHKLHMPESWYTQCEEYATAQSKVLFDGCKMHFSDKVNPSAYLLAQGKKPVAHSLDYINWEFRDRAITIEDIAHLRLILSDNGIKAIT